MKFNNPSRLFGSNVKIGNDINVLGFVTIMILASGTVCIVKSRKESQDNSEGFRLIRLSKSLIHM